MQRLFYLAAVTILLTVVFTACSKDDDSDHQKKMTLTVQTSDFTYVQIYMYGTGAMTIDWGDGTDTTYRFEKNGVTFQHLYSGTAAAATIVTITGKNITDLSCGRAQLLNVDVSENNVLQTLRCDDNYLTNVDVSKNTRLTDLSCGDNLLTSLDVSKNTRLTFLWCRSNQLTNVDVSKNTRLTHLWCEDNQLTSLDVSNNADLLWLICSSNRLTTLNVQRNIALASLDCDHNQLTNLDVSKNKALQLLYCRNNLFACEGLSALFASLHSNGGRIFIGNDQEIVDCDVSIATNKSWEVYDWWPYSPIL